jgi:hypothetical protein
MIGLTMILRKLDGLSNNQIAPSHYLYPAKEEKQMAAILFEGFHD